MSKKPTLLAQPGKMGTMELKNRLVMPAMCTNYTYQGHFTERAVHYYGLRAKGGAGLLIIEAAAIDYPVARSVLNCAVSDDSYIPTLKKVVDEVHKYDAKIALQIMHSGRQTSLAICGQQPVSCSDLVSAQSLYTSPRAMSIFEIKELIRKFGDAAWRGKEAGFDAVEVHCAHGYMLSAFLSPFVNNRKDEFGGLEGGLKVVCDVIREVKRRCGDDYPVLARINGDDYYPAGGITHIESRLVSVALEQAGVDCINIAGGLRESDHTLHDQSMASPRGSWVYMAEGIKKAVNIPVMVAKRLSEDMLEDILAEGKTDFVCVGRPHIADPDFGKKLLEGRPEDILPCIWCCQACYDVLWMLGPTTCLTNPAAGKPDEVPIESLEPAPTRKKVMVVGGGPAGAEAALVAAKRGHDVTLYEADTRLGGAYRTATVSPAKTEVERLFLYFERELPKAGVRINLGTTMTPDMVDSERPDAVVLAVGAKPVLPEKIPGIRGPNVVSVDDVMRGRADVGNRVVIWTCSYHCQDTCRIKPKPVEGDPTGIQTKTSYACRAGYAAVDTAEYLASKGKLVSIVTEREDVVYGMGYTSLNYLIKRFYRANIRVCGSVKVEAITDDGIVLAKAGHSFLMDADTVIVSVGDRKQKKTLTAALKGKVPELYAVGDCYKVGNAMTSIESAYEIAKKI
jgi:2,4-dienoyl-CoA reductase-like NADH-dependent reductase (Old Yellow Enzyme family)/thioredoxin reductase